MFVKGNWDHFHLGAGVGSCMSHDWPSIYIYDRHSWMTKY
jgi:hypothetical protein